MAEFRLTPGDLLTLFLLGRVGYTLQSGFFLSSVRFVPVSLASLLFCTYPALVSVLAFLTRGDKMSPGEPAALGLCATGLALVLGTPVDTLDWRGVALPLSGTLTYACYIVVGSKVVTKVPPRAASAFVA
jgi:drug/metabolite transporter (DMT)-like permease